MAFYGAQLTLTDPDIPYLLSSLLKDAGLTFGSNCRRLELNSDEGSANIGATVRVEASGGAGVPLLKGDTYYDQSTYSVITLDGYYLRSSKGGAKVNALIEVA